MNALVENFHLLAAAPNGVAKLRELILNLAVRGELVPQNPNDEPASELLKKIAAEKAWLLKEGKIRRDKPLPEISEDEKPYELPQGWEWVRLGEASQIIRGVSYDKAAASEAALDGHFPILRGHNINNRSLNFENLIYVPSRFVDEHQLIRRGDLVIAMSSGSADLVGKAGQADRDYEVGFGAFCGVVRSFHHSLFPYLGFFFQTPYYRERIASKGKGIGINNLNKGSLETLSVPLPPLPEQQRIVTKVDELMRLCDELEAQQTQQGEAHERLVATLLEALTRSADAQEFTQGWAQLAEHFELLFDTPESIAKLKQTLLQLAVQGKLVPQDPNDEPASELLKKIAAEKARLVKEGKKKKEKSLPEISQDEKPYTLPQGWAWVRFDSVVITRLGKMLDAAKNKGQLKPYLRNTNVQWGRFELDDIKEMRLSSEELDEFRVLKGDLLICEGGEPGRCAIWKGARDEIYFQKALHRARPVCGVLSEYVQHCFRVDSTNGLLETYFTGATIKHLPGDKLARYVMPLPPLAEQHRIVAKVDELMALCDALSDRLAQSRQLASQLAETLTQPA